MSREIDHKIIEAKRALSNLYKKRNELRKQQRLQSSSAKRSPRFSREERERQVLVLAKEGLVTNEIAVKIGLTSGTVKYYLWNALRHEALERLGKIGKAEKVKSYSGESYYWKAKNWEDEEPEIQRIVREFPCNPFKKRKIQLTEDPPWEE